MASQHQFLEICELLKNLQCMTISHTYKEGNIVVDLMAAICLKQTKLSNWEEIRELPRET